MSAARGGASCVNVHYSMYGTLYRVGGTVNGIGPRGRASDDQTLIAVWLRGFFCPCCQKEELNPIGTR